jgi:hypothetical protein
MTLTPEQFRSRRKVLMQKLFRAMGSKNQDKVDFLRKLINELDYEAITK